jgi:hypothetical protein
MQDTDTLLLMGPPSAIFWLLACPDQFKELVAWAATLF